MHLVDVAIVAVYLLAMLLVGVVFVRRAQTDLDSYFLGGRRIPWWALSMSGAVSNFDITGTMWIVSLIVVLGMRSMWVHWIWGFLLGAFFMVYIGKWVRRSGVMTAAEWMKTRFGEDRGGRAARYTYAAMAVLVTIAAVGYAFQGIGKFSAVYIPLEEWVDPATAFGAFVIAREAHLLATIVIGLTTLYVLFGGLLSVVFTDVIQTVILTVGAIIIGVIAWRQMTPETMAALPSDFGSVVPSWRLEFDDPEVSAEYGFFGALVLVWVAKGLLLNLGGPGQMYDFQRFLAAKDPRDAAKVGAAWSAFLVVRWGLAMGIALLALCVMNTEQADPEQVMPTVLRDFLPIGVRGLVIAGLLAAFMSTFSSTVNAGAAFVVRDLWLPLRGGQATQREGIVASYLSTLGLVVCGIAFGFQGESINAIWQWMMLALTGGIVVPNVLRWYWWRMNGWGYTIGTLAGVLPAIVLLLPEESFPAGVQQPYVFFPLIIAVSLLGSVVGSLTTRPTDRLTLESFHRQVKPFGFWGAQARHTERDPGDRLGRTLLNLLLAMIAVASLYLAPMYLVGHWYGRSAACAATAAGAFATLCFTWYRHLPAADRASASA